MTDYTYTVLKSRSGDNWWRFYKDVVGKDRAIAIAKRLARRTHQAVKVIHQQTNRNIWESDRPDFVRRE
jgi:hypothetical protein